jgi:hypothetical protein
LVIANKKIEAHEAEAKTMARRAALVEAGFEEEDVEEVLASFAEATDEMFDKVVALKKKGSLPPWLDKDKKDDDDKDEKDDKKKGMKKKAEVQAEDATEEEADEADTEAEAEVLEDVEEEVEPALADAGDDSSDELRASASEWLETNVLRSTANINK